jgi:hypothetical protein
VAIYKLHHSVELNAARSTSIPSVKTDFNFGILKSLRPHYYPSIQTLTVINLLSCGLKQVTMTISEFCSTFVVLALTSLVVPQVMAFGWLAESMAGEGDIAAITMLKERHYGRTVANPTRTLEKRTTVPTLDISPIFSGVIADLTGITPRPGGQHPDLAGALRQPDTIFDASSQLIDVTGQHKWVAPGPEDK